MDNSIETIKYFIQLMEYKNEMIKKLENENKSLSRTITSLSNEIKKQEEENKNLLKMYSLAIEDLNRDWKDEYQEEDVRCCDISAE